MSEALKEVLSVLIYMGVVTIIPILIYGIKVGMKALTEYLSTKTDNEVINMVIKEINGFISDAVTYTMQTYVDSLKKSGKFNEKSHEVAFNTAYEKALIFIPEESKELFESVYGNLEEYIKMQIEAQVKKLKLEEKKEE